jgi:hypothetical protein
VFKEHGNHGDNNLGLLTTKVCDAMVKFPGWSLATINGGNYGDDGTHREQQLVFRRDCHPLGDQPHVLLELRDAGYIEVNGQNVGDIYEKLEGYLRKTWGCEYAQAPTTAKDRLCDCKFRWKPMDMMVASAEVTAFFHQQGWQMQVCSQGTVKIPGMADSREQQILFRPGSSGLGIVEPHLFVELYMGEGRDELYSKPDVTQVLGGQHMRMCPVGDCAEAVRALHEFVVEYLGGSAGTDRYSLDVFLSRGLTDNNLGCWTMRLCDFMVDRLGWSFVVCNVCNIGACGQYREQQLVFRYDGERRQIPVNKEDNVPAVCKEQYAGLRFPSYWKVPEVLNFESPRAITACDSAELEALQEIVDHTFKRVLTRDRVYEQQTMSNEEMPFRLEVIHAFRSENASLYRGFARRQAKYWGTGTPLQAKTRNAGAMLNDRLCEGEGLLFHGTNPSSAMGILKTGFSLRNAGKSTGTMFGNGIYLAECSSKSDEYACDDSGGTYPQLNALLVCRSLIGKPHTVQEPGDHIAEAKLRGCDCVVGDREAKVGTYREFVFFEEEQVLPEYTIIYRRQYDREKVPDKMRQSTSGTTGKNWQVKMDKGWLNIPAITNQEILMKEAEGEAQFQLKVGGFLYSFDLSARTQTNMKSGTLRSIRPPMIKQASLSRSTTLSTCSSPSGRLSSGSSFSELSSLPTFVPAVRTPAR